MKVNKITFILLFFIFFIGLSILHNSNKVLRNKLHDVNMEVQQFRLTLDELNAVSHDVYTVIFNDTLVLDSLSTEYYDEEYDIYDISKQVSTLIVSANILTKKYATAVDKLEYDRNHIPHLNPFPQDDLQRIASGYGYRKDPFSTVKRFHFGIDLVARYGTEVNATATGKVYYTQNSKAGLGKLIILDHGNGYKTYYGHLSKIKVKIGEIIEIGTVIGKVGSTGRSTGAHLHYEIRLNDRPVNPSSHLFYKQIFNIDI